MGKKSRRRRGASGPRLSAAQLVQPGEQAAALAPAVAPQAPKASARAFRDLREEYPYVVADLKRIAIIAAVMLVLLLGLAFLLV
ncbi:MAG: hypothetical protein H5T61_05135 [Thermoflexales bacterium]|nr:hypothetical protein [Thermoflexales bacterium]